MTHWAKNCVTVNYYMDTFYGNTQLGDVIYEERSKKRGKSSMANYENHQLVFKQPMNIITFIQRSE